MYDAVVVGLGAVGSAALYQFAQRGLKVLGIEKYKTPHALGSTHGESRIIRQAYFEGDLYVPLVLRAYELWEKLEHDFGKQLLLRTGGLFFGTEDSKIVAGSIRTAKTLGLKHEVLGGAEIRRRFPPIGVPNNFIGLHEPAAGVLYPELCVQAFRSRAAAHGAVIRDNEPVIGWEASDSGVDIRTAAAMYRARSLVLAPGAWMPRLANGLDLPLSIRRLTMFWFRPLPPIQPFLPERFPIYIGEDSPGVEFYGFPALAGADGGAKIAFHHVSFPADPDAVDRTVSESEEAQMREIVRRYLPSLDGPLLRTATCLYTNTPDRMFVIDRHPLARRVIIASCCSGHGFKFAPAIGEALAALALDETPPVDVSAFGLSRF